MTSVPFIEDASIAEGALKRKQLRTHSSKKLLVEEISTKVEMFLVHVE